MSVVKRCSRSASWSRSWSRPVGEHSFQPPAECGRGPLDHAGAGRRELEELGPLVDGVGGPANQVASLQLLDPPGDGRGVDHQPVGQVAEPDAAARAEQAVQEAHVGAGQVDPGPLEHDLEDPTLGDQPAERLHALAERVEGGRLYHGGRRSHPATIVVCGK